MAPGRQQTDVVDSCLNKDNTLFNNVNVTNAANATESGKQWRSAPVSPSPHMVVGQNQPYAWTSSINVNNVSQQCLGLEDEDIDLVLQMLQQAAAEMQPGSHQHELQRDDEEQQQQQQHHHHHQVVPVCSDINQNIHSEECLPHDDTLLTPSQDLQLRQAWQTLQASASRRRGMAAPRGSPPTTCKMDQARLDQCNFSHADMEHASLRGASISKASFFSANLRGAVFDGAMLTDVDFSAADLTGASFQGCDPAAFFTSIAWYGACLHDVVWPNPQVAAHLQHRSSCRCMKQ